MDGIGFYIKSLPALIAHFNRDQVYIFPIEKNKGGYGKIRIPTVMVPKLKILIASGRSNAPEAHKYAGGAPAAGRGYSGICPC
jgi:hypothetical protein